MHLLSSTYKKHHEYLTSPHTHSLSIKRKYLQAHTKFSKIPTNFHITNIYKYSHTLIQIYTKTLEQLPTLHSHIYFIYILFILCPRCPQSVKEYMFMSKNKPFQITKLSSPFPVISLPGTSKPTDRNLTRAKSCVVWIHTAWSKLLLMQEVFTDQPVARGCVGRIRQSRCWQTIVAKLSTQVTPPLYPAHTLLPTLAAKKMEQDGNSDTLACNSTVSYTSHKKDGHVNQAGIK